MKRLHIFLLRSFLKPFIATFFIAIFILLMQFLWKYIDDLVGKGLDVIQIFQLLFYASARFVPIAIPIALLLASVMVFGKLGEQYELVALKSAGISFYKILSPLIIFVIFISYGSYLFSNYIMPIANLKNGSMIYNIQKKKPALNIREGIFYYDIDGYAIKVNKKLNDGVNLNGILIYDHTGNDGNTKVLSSRSGKMEITANGRFLNLFLYDGSSYIEVSNKKQKTPFRITNFKENLIRFDLNSFNAFSDSEKLYKGHYAMLNNKQLNYSIDSLNIKYKNKVSSIKENTLSQYLKNISSDTIRKKILVSNTKASYDIAINKLRKLKAQAKSNKNDLNYQNIIINKHKIEWHRKISLAVACLLLFLVGAPLGSIIRKGGFGLPVLFSIMFFLLFHVLNIIGEKSAKDLSMTPLEGMWLANFIFIPIIFFLMYKAKNDTKFIDLSSFYIFIYRIKNKIQ